VLSLLQFSLLILVHSAFASYIVTAVTWLVANPRYFTVPGSFTCAFTTIMGCRLILNLCRVYYHAIDVNVRPQSIWASSEGIRFKPPTLAAETTHGNWEMDREPGPLSSTIPTLSRTGAAYELCNLVKLDGEKQ
jgi:hypothetical protein